VRGDENLLKLVFLNLFDNAIKFGYAGTYIEISVRVTRGQCIVSFGNLGVGVPADERERVFRRLTKARWKDPVRQIEGLGLGLFFCRQVIRHQFGGRISLSSREAAVPKRRFEGDNWKTTVTIWLPLDVEE
jgi:signal transduction histidine kinase